MEVERTCNARIIHKWYHGPPDITVQPTCTRQAVLTIDGEDYCGQHGRQRALDILIKEGRAHGIYRPTAPSGKEGD